MGAAPRSSAGCASGRAAFGTPNPVLGGMLLDSLLLCFCVSEKRNVSSQWRKLRTDLVLVVQMGNLNGIAGERLFLDLLCSFIGNRGGEISMDSFFYDCVTDAAVELCRDPSF